MKESYSQNRHSYEAETSSKAEMADLQAHLKDLEAKDYYERLEISPTTNEEEIRNSLRKFATFHPGNKSKELQEIYGEIFKLYSEAVSVLKNPDERRKYNAQRFSRSSGPGAKAEKNTDRNEGYSTANSSSPEQSQNHPNGKESFERMEMEQEELNNQRADIIDKYSLNPSSSVKAVELRKIDSLKISLFQKYLEQAEPQYLQRLYNSVRNDRGLGFFSKEKTELLRKIEAKNREYGGREWA